MSRLDHAGAVRRFLKMALVAGLAAVPAAQAQEVKPVGEFGWFGVGKAYELEKGTSTGSASSAAHSSTTRATAVSSTWPA